MGIGEWGRKGVERSEPPGDFSSLVLPFPIRSQHTLSAGCVPVVNGSY